MTKASMKMLLLPVVVFVWGCAGAMMACAFLFMLFDAAGWYGMSVVAFIALTAWVLV